MQRKIPLFGGLMLLVIGIWWWTSNRPAVSVEVASVTVDSLDLSFTAEAFVIGKFYDLAPEASSRITSITINEGDHVLARQVLMTLDDSNARALIDAARQARLTAAALVSEAMSSYQMSISQREATIRRNRAAVDRAMAEYRRVFRGARKESIDQARHEIERLEAIKAEVSRRLARAERLVEAGALAPAQRDAIRMEHEVAVAQLELSKDALRQLESGPLPEEVESARATLEIARSDLRFAQKQQDEVKVRSAQVASAQFRLKEADIEIHRLASILDDYVVRSPVTGVVVRRLAEPGMIGSPQVVAIRISTREDLHVEAEIRSEDVDVVGVGTKVEISTPANPGDPLKGVVERMATMAEEKPDAAIRTRIVRARIRVIGDAKRLVPGLEVDVRGSKKQSVAGSIPSECVMIDGGRTTVFVVEGTRLSRRVVTIGRSESNRTEVLQGLRLGDQVVIVGSNPLEDGQEVVIAR